MSDGKLTFPDPVKRETGENPVRTRRCNKGVVFIETTEQIVWEGNTQ